MASSPQLLKVVTFTLDGTDYSDDALDLDQLMITDPSDDPETVVDKQDQCRILRECVLRLPQEHREIIDLVYYHEKSMEEVSSIFGIPVGTVKSRIARGREELRQRLREMGVHA